MAMHTGHEWISQFSDSWQRRRGGIVPAPPTSILDDGLPSSCTAGDEGERTSAKTPVPASRGRGYHFIGSEWPALASPSRPSGGVIFDWGVGSSEESSGTSESSLSESIWGVPRPLRLRGGTGRKGGSTGKGRDPRARPRIVADEAPIDPPPLPRREPRVVLRPLPVEVVERLRSRTPEDSGDTSMSVDIETTGISEAEFRLLEREEMRRTGILPPERPSAPVGTTPRTKGRGRPRLDGTGPFRSPSPPSDSAEMEIRLRGQPMEGYRARRLEGGRIDPPGAGSRGTRPTVRVKPPSHSFFTPEQRRHVDRNLEILQRSTSQEVAAMADAWLVDAESARARSTNIRGAESGQLKMGVHLSREALLLLAYRAMGRVGDTPSDGDRAETARLELLRERRECDRLRSELGAARREAIAQAGRAKQDRQTAEAYIRRFQRVPAELRQQLLVEDDVTEGCGVVDPPGEGVPGPSSWGRLDGGTPPPSSSTPMVVASPPSPPPPVRVARRKMPSSEASTRGSPRRDHSPAFVRELREALGVIYERLGSLERARALRCPPARPHIPTRVGFDFPEDGGMYPPPRGRRGKSAPEVVVGPPSRDPFVSGTPRLRTGRTFARVLRGDSGSELSPSPLRRSTRGSTRGVADPRPGIPGGILRHAPARIGGPPLSRGGDAQTGRRPGDSRPTLPPPLTRSARNTRRRRARRRRRMRGGGGEAGGAPPPTAPPSPAGARTPRGRELIARLKRRIPRASAISVLLEPNAVPTYPEVAARIREYVRPKLRDLGVETLRAGGRTQSGAILYEIPGRGKEAIADAFADTLRGLFIGEPEVRISRPQRRADLRITGLDEAATADDVVEAIAGEGGCPHSLVRAGVIRRSRAGVGTVWAQCPSHVAAKVATAGRLMIGGWVSARVDLLPGRPLRCFRCLAPGHTQSRCPSSEDRHLDCFRCGRPGHFQAQCRDKPHCPACLERGLPADHRTGGTGCPRVRPLPATRPTPSGSLPVRRKKGPRPLPPSPSGEEMEAMDDEPLLEGPPPPLLDPPDFGLERDGAVSPPGCATAGPECTDPVFLPDTAATAVSTDTRAVDPASRSRAESRDSPEPPGSKRARRVSPYPPAVAWVLSLAPTAAEDGGEAPAPEIEADVGEGGSTDEESMATDADVSHYEELPVDPPLADQPGPMGRLYRRLAERATRGIMRAEERERVQALSTPEPPTSASDPGVSSRGDGQASSSPYPE